MFENIVGDAILLTLGNPDIAACRSWGHGFGRMPGRSDKSAGQRQKQGEGWPDE